MNSQNPQDDANKPKDEAARTPSNLPGAQPPQQKPQRRKKIKNYGYRGYGGGGLGLTTDAAFYGNED